MPSLHVFPDLAQIFGHFLSGHENLDEVAYGQPQALLDSLLALTIHATQQPITAPSSDTEFKHFILTLTACTAHQSHGIVRQIPATIVHSHPSQLTRFKLVRKILEDDRLRLARDSAIGWLKEEMMGRATHSSTENIFLDPPHFLVLFSLLFHQVPTTNPADLANSWTQFTQIQGPSLHSALNLYYLLLSTASLRDKLHLEKTVKDFRSKTLQPLHQLFRTFETDLTKNGGDGLIESAVGEEMCSVGMTRCGLLGLVLDEIENVANDVFGTDEMELLDLEDEEKVRIEDIRMETVF